MEKIKQITDQNEQLSVLEIARALEVSESTVRRCLSILEQEGKLMRSYGGAKKIPVIQEAIFAKKYPVHAREKRAIARYASTLIQDGDTLILDGSSTSAYLSAHLMDKRNLVVLTNGLPIIRDFIAQRDTSPEDSPALSNRLIVLGGELRLSSLSTMDAFSLSLLNHYRVNKLLFSAVGVDQDAGITVSDAHDARQTQIMMDVADEVILMVDSSKFHQKSFCVVAPLSGVDHLITDENVDKATIRAIRQQFPHMKLSVVPL